MTRDALTARRCFDVEETHELESTIPSAMSSDRRVGHVAEVVLFEGSLFFGPLWFRKLDECNDVPSVAQTWRAFCNRVSRPVELHRFSSALAFLIAAILVNAVSKMVCPV